MSRNDPNELKKLMLTLGGRGTGPTLARDRRRLAAVLSINFLSRNGANELKKLMLTPGGRGTGPTLARDRHGLAAVLSINFLSRNGANEPKKLMLTPPGGNGPRPARRWPETCRDFGCASRFLSSSLTIRTFRCRQLWGRQVPIG